MGSSLDFLSEAAESLMDSPLNPISWPKHAYDAFKEGQARDEARQVRGEDVARETAFNERNSVSGRIKEGKAMGLSTLAAAGVQPTSGGVQSIGQDTSYLNTSGSQNAMSSSDRTTARLGQALLTQQIEGQRLENLKKSQELTVPKVGQGNPGDDFLPGGSQTIKGGITEKNLSRTKSYPGSSHMEAGSINSLGYAKSPTGLGPIPSGDVKERIEDSPYELTNFYRYGVMPNFGDRSSAPPRLPEMVKRGEVWNWSKKYQEWQVVPLENDLHHNWLYRKFLKKFNWKED